MNVRSPIDLCLLCQTNPANKKNSHILPKFLANSFLRPKGEPQKGFSISISINSDKNRIKTIQDSPKKDYIFCKDCEADFSILEDIASDTFTNWELNVSENKFLLTPIGGGCEILECTNIDKKTFHLFNYSIFWRVSISSSFGNFKIEQEFENELRDILNAYKQTKKLNFLKSLKSKSDFKIFPTTIFTAKSLTKERNNFLLAIPVKYPYSLVVNKFVFKLYRDIGDMENEDEKSLVNFNKCNMIVYCEEIWEVFIQHSIEFLLKVKNNIS